jgi:hypothetical protein
VIGIVQPLANERRIRSYRREHLAGGDLDMSERLDGIPIQSCKQFRRGRRGGIERNNADHIVGNAWRLARQLTPARGRSIEKAG